ncbi:MAG TPA: helix-turn-helix domain-containing protein [Pyrinomonadaceae bacterium]
MSIRDDIERARALLSKGRKREAVEAAASAVRALEDGTEQGLLPEALMTQGAALARAGDHNLARLALERAASLAEQAEDFQSAGMALLTLIEELHAQLPADELRSIYHSADKRLSGSQDISTLARLRGCARRVLDARLPGASHVDEPQTSRDWKGCSLEEEVLSYERKLIRLALDTTQGKVTQAAELLGITHQSLSFILATRHKDLLEARRPPRPRRRSAKRPSVKRPSLPEQDGDE